MHKIKLVIDRISFFLSLRNWYNNTEKRFKELSCKYLKCTILRIIFIKAGFYLGPHKKSTVS